MEKLFSAVDLDPATAERALSAMCDLPMTGWLELPIQERADELAQVKAAAARIQETAQVLVCIGVGGSYLGHKALIEAIDGRIGAGVEVLYAGSSLDSHALEQMLEHINGRDFCVNVISKSGTTTEVLITWRIFRERLQERYGEAWTERVYVTTDATEGLLHDEAIANGYHRFVLPGEVGGRYSVLSNVGLLPMAAAGIDIDELLAGARAEHELIFKKGADGDAATVDLTDAAAADATDLTQTGVVFVNTAGDFAAGRAAVLNYALVRQQLYREGADTEVFASFHPRLTSFGGWWQQLFGESEGKDNQGIFPVFATYTTDLHSLGQFMQQGRRNLFETILEVLHDQCAPRVIPAAATDDQGQDWLGGKNLAEVNRAACQATIEAHRAGEIAVNQLRIPDFSARSFGALVFYLEVACAVSATLAGVNPFDQPGVEAYKQGMFKLLGKE